MKDYSNSRFWAISGLGYGKGDDVAEAVQNHDEIQGQNWGENLTVPVAEIPLTVWEAPEWSNGFVSDGSIRWTAQGRAELADGKTQIRAVRNPAEYWTEWAEEAGLSYETVI
jgi:hypothetical protein